MGLVIYLGQEKRGDGAEVFSCSKGLLKLTVKE